MKGMKSIFTILTYVVLLISLPKTNSQDELDMTISSNASAEADGDLLIEGDLTGVININGSLNEIGNLNETLGTSLNETELYGTPDNLLDEGEEDLVSTTEEEGQTEVTNGTDSQVVSKCSCKMGDTLSSVVTSIKHLTDEIKELKMKISEKCDDVKLGGVNATEFTRNVSDDKKTNETMGGEDEKEELSLENDLPEDGLPKIPTECDEPFKLIAKSCFFFLYYPNDWKNWGDANAYCQTLGGTLAAPYRPQELRQYLEDNFSNVFWVGAKKVPQNNTFEWLTGKEMTKNDWKEGQPSKSAAKFCVYLEYFSGYKAINHYCGEKFSFVCEKRNGQE